MPPADPKLAVTGRTRVLLIVLAIVVTGGADLCAVAGGRAEEFAV